MISRSASIVLLALALALTLGACQPDPQTNAEAVAVDLAAEREAVMAPERESSAMYGRGDVDGIAALLADESVLPAPVRPPTVGRDSVVAATRALLAAEAADGVSVSWEPVDAVVSPSGDMAFDWGRAATTLADGSVVEGSYLVVWTREDGEWKVAADLFN
ncbi:YybH family protein [Rubrivirga marina]|uniref:DUF4440 domain-containing protein n=1 Tax=Rubrivirga marina TaxID=1196024 RepID=A0A271IW23_9BACT|nr:nuclear transport factor 2 family protein [Rubrivirga marina]PAP75451.1 hypothetical protein BSZ37_02815 [Rubrivirga marina]